MKSLIFHKQVEVSGKRPNGANWHCTCDEQIKDFITLLNNNGYVTHYSCCGEGERCRCGGYISLSYPTYYAKYDRLIHMLKSRFRDKYVLLDRVENGRMRFAIKDYLTLRQIKHELILINTPPD